MKIPGFQFSLVRIFGAILFALTAGLRAEPPANPPDQSAAKVSPSVTRAKPQIIYHVRPASNYSATLHSQDKTQTHELPIDESMPTSLQLSRANANAAAAEAAAAQARARQQAAPQQQRVRKRSHPQIRPMNRPPMSFKAKGHGPKGPKGHKH